MISRHLAFALFALCIAVPESTSFAQIGPNYRVVQELTQGGIFPVHPVFGDVFGQVVTQNGDFLFVSSFGSQPGGKLVAGAVFVYEWDGVAYQQTQVLTTGGSVDHLGVFQVLSDKEWLVVSAIGTPAGPQDPDTAAQQDFKGAVFIYRLSEETGLFELSQTLDSTTPGLEGLNGNVNGGANIFTNSKGANFGFRMSLDASAGCLLVGAQYQDNTGPNGQPLINSGRVYSFDLDRKTEHWALSQVLTNPDGVARLDTFGATVAVRGNTAMVSNGAVAELPRFFSNASVYVYRRHGPGAPWIFAQRLQGTQTGLTLLTIHGLPPLPVGDAFGSALALGENWALIGAPLESRTMANGQFTGAAYFFRRVRERGEERWEMSERVESDDPRSLVFGVINADLTESWAIIPDIDRPDAAGVPRGGAHVYRRVGETWVRTAILTDPAGQPLAGFGSGVSLGSGRIAVGTSAFQGFFLTRFVRPPAFPPARNGKVLIYQAQ